jgi:hypothetical protein
MVKRKRAPGAGRKPKGEFANLPSPFSLRMPEDLRQQLEQAASRSNRSVSQEILRRVTDSFEIENDKGRKPETRALCFLVARLEEIVSNETDGHWRTNPYFYRAFKQALNDLLEKMRPVGELVTRSPETRSPEECGKFVADYVWNEMHAPPIDYSGFSSALASHFGLSKEASKRGYSLVAKHEYAQKYAYPNVRRDLVLEPRKQRK